MKRSILSAVVFVGLVGAAVAVASVPRCAWGADLTISNQVGYHHREVFVSLQGVPLARAVKAIYQRALAPRGVSFIDAGVAATDDEVTIQYQGPPWQLVELLRDLLEARGYSLHTTAWGSDVIVPSRVGPALPGVAPPVVPRLAPGDGAGAGQ